MNAQTNLTYLNTVFFECSRQLQQPSSADEGEGGTSAGRKGGWGESPQRGGSPKDHGLPGSPIGEGRSRRPHKSQRHTLKSGRLQIMTT